MADPDLKKRAVFFLGFAGFITLILLALPFIETWLQDLLLRSFGLAVTTDGKTVSGDGSAPGVMTETTIGLIVNILHILKVILWMALVISTVRFIGYLIFGRAFRGSNQSEISSLLRTVLSVIIYIVAFFIVFQSQYPAVQLAPLFTGSAILGIVVGLALQDTLGNLFAGIALQADQPFQVGDVINITNRGTGVVESVSWRGVKIRTFQNKLLIISNAVLGRETIEVAPRGNLNARVVFFNTVYSQSPARTAQAVRDAVRQVENVSQKIRPVVRIRDLADSSIDWEIKYWPEDYAKYSDTDAQIRQRIWYVFQRENIEFAFPTRTIYLEEAPEEATAVELVDTAAERLSRIEIFAPLSDEETERLAVASAARVYAPGEPIVRMGQEGNSMFVIIRGSVKVQIQENGSQRTVNQLRENDFFGEMSLLTGQPRSATVVAAEETEVLQIKKAGLKPIFESNPRLVSSICEIIDERQKLLGHVEPALPAQEDHEDRSVLGSIRKFFGLG